MWFLKTLDGKLIYLKPNISVSIGRKKGDIILPNDASISRLHASIVVKPHTEFLASKPTSLCVLKDEGSKYGTYISRNEKFERITSDTNVNNKDMIRIGLQREVFIAAYKPIITMASALEDNDKDKLLQIMDDIDGVVISEWNKYCTHLTVVKPKLTQKVAISLAAGIPIVSIDYWDTMKSSIEKGDPLPETDNFVPEINEKYVFKEAVSLSPNCKRKTLFTNLTFNFFSLDQYEMYKTIITLAGGKIVLYNLNNKEDNSLNCNSIFIQYCSDDSTQFTENSKKNYDYICKKLNTSKLRIIPEPEISLAILHCSIEQYCNPKYNFRKFLKRQKKRSYNVPETLVLDTQDQDVLIIKDFTNKQTASHSKNYIQESDCDDNESTQEDEMLWESSDSPEQSTSQYTASKKVVIPETIESFYDSPRNADKYNDEDKRRKKNVAKSYTRDSCSFKANACIPETIDDNCSNSFNNSNKNGQTSNSFTLLNMCKDCNVSMRKPKKTSNRYMFVSRKNSSTITNNVQSDKIQIEKEVHKNSTPINASDVKLLEKTGTDKENNTLHAPTRCNPPGITNSVQSNKIQIEKEVHKNSTPTNASDVKLFEKTDTDEENSTLNVPIRCNPLGITNSVQSDKIQIEKEVHKNSTPIDTSDVEILEDTDNEEETSTVHVPIRRNPPGITNSVQLDKIQIEKEVHKNSTPIDTSDVELLEDTDNEEENSTVHVPIRRNPPGKTFQKACVKIPKKRLRLMQTAEEY